VYGLFDDKEESDGGAALDDLGSAIHLISTLLRWFGMSWITEVKEKQPSAQHMWELLQHCWNSIPGEAG
jgi:hypothetical protein